MLPCVRRRDVTSPSVVCISPACIVVGCDLAVYFHIVTPEQFVVVTFNHFCAIAEKTRVSYVDRCDEVKHVEIVRILYGVLNMLYNF